MGKRCLIDSNVVIDICIGRLPAAGMRLMEDIEPELSVITNMELFAFKDIPQAEYETLKAFVAISVVHPVTVDLIELTIRIRQERRIKLPDAIIAATALYYSLPLVTRNTSDFKNINGLLVYNPYDM